MLCIIGIDSQYDYRYPESTYKTSHVVVSARGELRAAAPDGALPRLLRHRLQRQTVGAARRGAQLRQGSGGQGMMHGIVKHYVDQL